MGEQRNILAYGRPPAARVGRAAFRTSIADGVKTVVVFPMGLLHDAAFQGGAIVLTLAAIFLAAAALGGAANTVGLALKSARYRSTRVSKATMRICTFIWPVGELITSFADEPGLSGKLQNCSNEISTWLRQFCTKSLRKRGSGIPAPWESSFPMRFYSNIFDRSLYPLTTRNISSGDVSGRYAIRYE